MAASDTRTAEPADLRDTASLVDYAKTLDCIHCGLCLETCPTYRLTGVESSSPRGRIHLMRAVGEGRAPADASFAEEMDFCLLCRHCESVCPAGVRFGAMMETTRGTLEGAGHRSWLARTLRRLAFRGLLPHRLRLRLAGSLLRFAQLTGLLRLVAALAGKRGAALRGLPAVPPLRLRALLPERTAARGSRRDEVALLQGCIMPELFSSVGRATVASLSDLGTAVRVPTDVVCCGSLHAHNGDLEGARELARTMIERFEHERGEDGEPLRVVTNSAGCGAHMKECAHLFDPGDPWRARAEAFAARVLDYTELAAELLERAKDVELRVPAGLLDGPLAWDDPCHLCHGQGVRAEPRRVLARVAGLEQVPLPDSEACCGSAGIYSILRPDDAAGVFAAKLDALARCGARTVVTANPGCQLQWQAGLRAAGVDARVVHLAELVALSGRGRG